MPPSPSGLVSDSNYVTAMSHFYRGEMGRIMAWRARLDATSTWAITTTTTIFTVSFSFPEVPHIIFFFNICIVSIMLWIESRRYRFYDAFRGRVRMLEAHFLVPMVARSNRMLQGEWQKLVCEDLLLPSFKISKLEALGRRLKRNYFFIYLVILAAWSVKVLMHSRVPITNVSTFYQALGVKGFPSWAVLVVFLFTYGALGALTIWTTRHSSGEISEFGARRTDWNI